MCSDSTPARVPDPDRRSDAAETTDSETTDSEAPDSEAPDPESAASAKAAESLLGYLVLGIFFGIVLTQSEVISWFRIQEMFRFQAFHMYGIIGSAVAVAAGSLALIRRFDVRTLGGEPIEIAPKIMGRGHRYWIGGTSFGVGWALTGACPGPLFALVGNGITVYLVAIGAALVGTWTYGVLRPRLPHY